MVLLRDVYSANAEKAEKNIPDAIADSNEMTGFMLELLDQVKAGDIEIETPMDAVALMMVKMGVSEQEMSEVLAELPDNSDSISEDMAQGILDRFGINNDDFAEVLERYGIAENT